LAKRAPCIMLLALLLALLSFAVALKNGSYDLEWGELLSVLKQGVIGKQEGVAAEIVWQLRLPRAVAGFACGGLLAIAGALMQVLLRNPLADPYVLGISGGAGVGALLAMLAGLSAAWLGGAALAGALCSMLLVFALAHGRGGWTQTRLLLTGVIMASAASAVITLILSLAPQTQLKGMLFWLMGDLSQSNMPGLALVILFVLFLFVMPLARDLNLLARGRELASALGVATKKVTLIIYLIASLATATVVTQAGAIGFVGLIVPHLVRLLIGNDQRLLLPTAVLTGGALLTTADTLARYLFVPQQLPVGVLTALIGAPLFLFLLFQQKV